MTWIPRFVFPWALALLLTVPWAVWLGARIHSLSGVRKWLAVSLRAIILILLVGALAGAELVRTEDKLAVFFLLDHSDSVPVGTRAASAQSVRNMAERYMTSDDEAGVVVFGKDPSIELSPDASLGLGDILSYVDGEHTDLAAAIRLAMAAFPQGRMKRIVVFSDGNETRGSVLEEVKLARAAGIEVDVVPLQTGAAQEVRIKEVVMPSQANADEPFQLRVVAHAEQDSAATLRVFQRVGDQRRLLLPQEVTLQKGDNTFVLTQELDSPGFYEYEVTIESESDSVLANNEGRAFSIVQGEPTVLQVDAVPEQGDALEAALTAEGIRVVRSPPGNLPVSLAQLQNYDAVVLSNVSSTDLSADQLRSLEAMVRDLGIGLVMIGGPDGFGAGGYLDTPIENALPVDMDVKQRKILPRGALALIMHTCEFADGNAWAREIALASLNVLSSQDLMGMLGYMWGGDSTTGDKWIFELQPVGDKEIMRRTIRRASTQIGDMPSVDPTLRMAFAGLRNADAAARRIVLISDGDPGAPTPGLVRDIADAGISVSTVCINPHSPNDVNMLRGLSEKTGGTFYFVKDPNNLPQIFTKEAAIVKRGLLMEKPFTPAFNHDSELLGGLTETPMPDLLGYVVTTAKESATVPLVSPENDPVLAHWRYGLGKSVAFTSDATNRWGVNWLGWEGYNRFWAQTVRWATRELTPTSFRVESTVRDGMGRVRIDAVDDEGRFINFLRPRGVVTGPGPDYARSDLELVQTGPGIYEGAFPLAQTGVYMINILYNRADGTQGTIPAGLSLGYSPEYEYTTTNAPLLEQIAALGDGRVFDADANPFEHNLVATATVTPIWHILAAVAACLFPVEIFVRRVVVPFSAVYAPVASALRRLPLLRRIVPEPAARPAPVTGTYASAAEARTREFAPQSEGAPSFGEVSAPEAQALETAAPAAAAEAAPDYTQQLLAAKERAIARKTRRTETKDKDE